jgi:hypothetical protein
MGEHIKKNNTSPFYLLFHIIFFFSCQKTPPAAGGPRRFYVKANPFSPLLLEPLQEQLLKLLPLLQLELPQLLASQLLLL